MEKTDFDVFVIGSGSAGKTVADACAENGLNVAITDNREYGGTCANRGCDPKKVLLGATEIAELAKNLEGHGIAKKQLLDWKQLQNFKRTFTNGIPEATEKNLKDLGTTLFHGSPKFIGKQSVLIEGKSITAKKIVIATGLVPRKLKFQGNYYLKDSADFLRLKKLPKNIVFIGAGYVGMEFAHMAARAGSKVTVMESGSRPLKNFDGDLVFELTQASENLGIRFIYNVEIDTIEKLRKNLRIKYVQDGKKRSMKAKKVFNTSGRVPAIAELDLHKGEIASSERGVKVNEFLQSTSNPNVYACGDVSDYGLPLSSLSSLQGYVVGQNIVHGNKKKIDTPVVPSVVFTLPNLATVGMSAEEATKRFKNVQVRYESVPDWFNAKRLNAPFYSFKTIINTRNGALLGAHLLGPAASETINLFAMAITNGTTSEQLKKMIFTYPSWSNDIKSMV